MVFSDGEDDETNLFAADERSNHEEKIFFLFTKRFFTNVFLCLIIIMYKQKIKKNACLSINFNQKDKKFLE